MKTDPHLHLFDLKKYHPHCFEELQQSGRFTVTSLYSPQEWDALCDQRLKGYRFGMSFGIHPQAPVWDHAALLAQAAASGHICAIGECGFDFYEGRESAAEKIQDEIFVYQLDLAKRFDLPLIVHLRRATDKAFEYKRQLKQLPAVVFHSWPAPFQEGWALLRAGVNAYFSLGTPLIQGNQKAIHSLLQLPPDRILMETDAPYQTIKGHEFTSLSDLELVYERAASLKGIDEILWEKQMEHNFRAVFTRLFEGDCKLWD